MRFGAPSLLWGLALVPLALLLSAAAERRRRARVAGFASPALLPAVVPNTPRWRRHVPTALYLAAGAALLLALARPEAVRAVPRQHAVLLLVVDTSDSMRSTDIVPSRLAAAQRAAGSLLDTLPARFDVGLVSFDRGARVLSLPTRDRRVVREALRSITTRRATAIGDGIELALDLQSRVSAIRRGRVPAAVVLLTDGRNTHGSDPLAAALTARRRRVPVHVVAIGDPTRPAARGVVPDFDSLRVIATTTGGRFATAAESKRLEEVYRELGSTVLRVPERRPLTTLFVGVGAALLVAGAGASLRWFNRFP